MTPLPPCVKTARTRSVSIAGKRMTLARCPVGFSGERVCPGTACHVAGANDVSAAIEKHLGVKNGETTVDREFTVETVSCLGCRYRN